MAREPTSPAVPSGHRGVGAGEPRGATGPIAPEVGVPGTHPARSWLATVYGPRLLSGRAFLTLPMKWWPQIPWVRCFRMSRAAVLDLAERLRPVLRREDTNMRAAIPVEKRVALTLWKLASADSYRSVARRFGVGVSTASVIVMEVCEAIRAVLLRHVVRLGDAQAVMEGFARAGFPNCIGAADETHIPILCSPHGASAYVSGKGLVSMVLQALVDSAGRFTDVYAGWSGAFGPQTTTEIGGVPMGPVLLGGPACPLRPWLMTPFPAARTRRQERFNARLRRCHAPAAHAFGRLKGRWRCLLKRLDVAERNVPLVVVACCVLHNLCERRGEAMQGGWEEGLEAEKRTCTPASTVFLLATLLPCR
uniref:DDE Tnp4 domain-containing protein n=1 Tax=Varanus komodoensis TaxID=61221 RepID=A0A8D2JEF5_VARKO